jgi:peptidylprolyl isomerase
MKQLRLMASAALIAALTCSGISNDVVAETKKKGAPMQENEKSIVTTPSGLKYRDEKVGTGAVAQKGKKVSVHYTGWLDQSGARGSKFDSSRDRGEPFQFSLGAQQVIAGWDEGVAGMQIGGVRTLMIPPNLGYGARGAGNVIPPNASLIFEVELLGVTP